LSSLTIPYRVLFPTIIAFACIGTYSLGLNRYHVYAIAFFGVLGYFLLKVGCEPGPAAARVRARTAAGGAPAPGDDHLARRSVHPSSPDRSRSRS
jgi:Tripartite tricarboxylate transporter TctA family